MTLSIRKIIVGITGCLASTLASATIIYDFSPDATGADYIQTGDSGPLINNSAGVNWIENPILDTTPFRITGMDIYTWADRVSLSTEVLIKVVRSTPAGPIQTSFTSIISVIDQSGTSSIPNNGATAPDTPIDHVRAFADFGPNSIQLDGSPFIIGMSGLNSDIGALALDWNTGIPHPGRDGYLNGFDGTGAPITALFDGDLAFRLHASVPDSGPSLTLLSLGFLALAAIAKKRRC